MIEYTEKKKFKPNDVDALFHAAKAPEGNYRSRLIKSLMNSPTVYTAWDGGRLVGLIRALDDTEMVAYIKTLVVDPAYEGQGIEDALIQHVAEKYKNFLYIDGITDAKHPLSVFEKSGFRKIENESPVEIKNDAPYMMY